MKLNSIIQWTIVVAVAMWMAWGLGFYGLGWRMGRADHIEVLRTISLPQTVPNHVELIKKLQPQHFPLSVVPGGFQSVSELQILADSDPVVRAAMAGFDWKTARIYALDKDWKCFVTFRIGDQILWTTKKIFLPRGTSVLSDDKGHTLLLRCGNQVSFIPQEPAQEPPVDLTTPVTTAPPVYLPPTQTADLFPPERFDAPAMISFDAPKEPIYYGGFVPVGGCCIGFPSAKTPPVAAPEPSTLASMTVGIAALVGFALVRRAAR